jgi:phospholipase C
VASLVNAFDFDNPDFTIPNLPAAKQPHVNAGGNYDGAAFCESQFRNPRPPVPYTGPGAIKDVASLAETGFKTVRGMLTEGRFLVLETDGLALTNPSTCGSGSGSESDDLALTRASPQHDRLLQRWVIHAVVIGGDEFTFTSAVDGRYICDGGKLCGDSGKATVFVVDFKPGKGHGFEVKGSGGGFLVASGKKLSFSGEEAFWQVFSVTGRGR